MVINAKLSAMTIKAEGYVGPTNWGLHYDAERWLKEGRFDIAVIIAQTAFEVTWKRVHDARPGSRSVLTRRLEKHPQWGRYKVLRETARNVFVHEGRRPSGGDAQEFVKCVGELMTFMDAYLALG